MLAWTSTIQNGEYLKIKSLINITSTFCEGYGVGFKGVVIKSPHRYLIGKEVKVDGRSTKFNQYFKKLKS